MLYVEPHPRNIHREGYQTLILGCMVASLLISIAAVKWWPIPTEDFTDKVFSTRGQETIQMEDIPPTKHSLERRPPPPAPLPPIEVPNDVILEELDLDFTDSALPTESPGIDEEYRIGDPEGSPSQLAVSEIGPKLLRFVEPEYTRAARRKRVRAEVVVEVLVDVRGQVQDTRILERYLLTDGGGKEEVSELGYGLEESTLLAAARLLYRPAHQNDTPVQSFTTVIFSFGD